MDTPNAPADPSAQLQQLAQEAANEPEVGSVVAVGPDARGADTGNPLVVLPFNEAFMAEIWEKVTKGSDVIQKQGEAWDMLLKAYLPDVKALGTPEKVNTNGHFRNTHTKIAHLYLQTPEIRVMDQPVGPGDAKRPSPINPQVMVELNDVIPIKQEIINKTIGRDGIKVDRLFDQLLFDDVAWAGIACSKLGHTAIVQTVQEPVMQPDPSFVPPMSTNSLMPAPPVQAPQVPVLDPTTQQPMTRAVQVPIYEEDYWRRFSPKKLVIDAGCQSTMYDDDAALMGMWFSMLPHQAKRAFNLKDEEMTGAGEDDKKFKHKDFDDNAPKVIMGVELFIKATSIDPALLFPNNPDRAVHPKMLLQMVLLKGKTDAPVVWRPCLDQTFTDQGELTDDSIDRFPIRVMCLRDVADSSLPMADSAFTNPLVKQRNTNRTQAIALRDAAIPKILVDSGAFEDGEVAALKSGKPGEVILVGEGRLSGGVDTVMGATPTPKMSPDFYQLDAQLSRDMDDTLGINDNTAGNTTDTVRSATETSVVNQGVANRMEKERSRVIEHLLDGVRLLDILISRYTTQTKWAKIAGPDGAQVIQAWNGQMVSGRWTYEIAPDSQFRVDTAVDRQQVLGFYNLVAKDPLVNRIPILRRMARMFGFDPNKVIADPILMAMQPPHGGVVNQHEGAKSGGTENGPGQPNAQNDQQEMQNPGMGPGPKKPPTP